MSSCSPLRYPGGKNQMYEQVVEMFDINNLKNYAYAEPFAGGAGVAIRLLLEGKVKSIYINDLDKSIYAFWTAVVYHSEVLIEKIESTEISIKEWHLQKIIQDNKDEYSMSNIADIVELGFSTFFLNRTNRSGIISAGPIGGKNQSGNYKLDCRFNKDKLIKLISQIASQKKKITVTNLDVLDFIDFIKYKKKIFLFIDPPYYKMGASLYYNSLGHDDHVKIEETIRKKLKNKKWIVTYDKCDEIKEIYKKHQTEVNSLRYSLQKKTKKEEYLFYRNIEVKITYD